jgi:penicillin-binding protein 1A
VNGKGEVLEDLAATVAKEEKREPSSLKTPLTPAQANPELQEAGLVITPQTAFVMTDMLKGVIREGTGRGASVVPAPVAGKTGTSNDQRDAWFVGYTPFVMTGIWVGYDKDKPLDAGETGGKAATPIWAEYMLDVVKDYPKTDFQIPDDVVFAYVDKNTGKLATSSTAQRVRVAFKVGTVPNKNGDNLPRVGEPGTRATSNEGSTGGATSEKYPKPEETSDFIREGYPE